MKTDLSQRDSEVLLVPRTRFVASSAARHSGQVVRELGFQQASRHNVISRRRFCPAVNAKPWPFAAHILIVEALRQAGKAGSIAKEI